jgi:DNA-binding FrmR family transcriptional regulator
VYAEIELSGFGKLLISQNKVKQRLKRYEGILTGTLRMLNEASPERIEPLTKRVHTVNESIKTLQSRIIPQ